MVEERRECERCGAPMLEVVYGMPSPELVEAVDRGEVVAGGCLLDEGQPAWRCSSCGAEQE